MSRIKWVERRLENWGRWCAQSTAGSLGYPRQAAFARLSPSGGGGDWRVPIHDLDASEIDAAVTSLKLSQSHLYLVLVLTYARGLPRHQVARAMGRAESTVNANLGAADVAISRWLSARKDEIKAQHIF